MFSMHLSALVFMSVVTPDIPEFVNVLNVEFNDIAVGVVESFEFINQFTDNEIHQDMGGKHHKTEVEEYSYKPTLTTLCGVIPAVWIPGSGVSHHIPPTIFSLYFEEGEHSIEEVGVIELIIHDIPPINATKQETSYIGVTSEYGQEHSNNSEYGGDIECNDIEQSTDSSEQLYDL